jgi:hypothetical protein
MSQIIGANYVLPPSVPTTFRTTAGDAIPALNILTLTNGANFTFTGAGSAVTGAVSGTTQFAVQVGSAAGALSSLALGNAGEVLTSNGVGFNPSWQTSVGITWSREAGAAVAAVANHGYINTNVGLTTFTLPAAAALGTVIEIVGESAALWTIAQNAGQNIQYGNVSTTPGIGGSLSASNRYDSVRIVCRVADTTWQVSPAPVGVLNVI